MNLYVVLLHISFILVLRCVLSSTITEKGEEEQADALDEENESLHESYRPHRMKHSKMFNIKGHNRRRREYFNSNIRQNCAIMYKNQEPIGIIEPYQDSYRLLPVDAEEQIPVEIDPIMSKRHAVEAETSSYEEEDLNKGFKSRIANERYPYIFAKFKVDSRLDKLPHASRTKRNLDKKLIGEKHMESLTDTLSKIQNHDEGAEDKLQSILNEIGLIKDDDEMEKREAKGEDNEKLAVGLVEHDNVMEKRDLKGVDNEKSEEQLLNSANLIEIGNRYEHRQENQIEDKNKDNEIDLMEESGSKSRDQPTHEEKNEREKRQDLSEEMKNSIQEKLSKLKEEVQSEIEQLKANQDSETDNDEEMDQEKAQRRKRNVVATLIDEETSDIDPLKDTDNGLVPHVRRRRQVDGSQGKMNIIPSEQQFLSRNLKQYYEIDENDLEENINEQKSADERERTKKSCKCKEGDKNCLCNKSSGKQNQQSRFQDGRYLLDIEPDSYRIVEQSDYVGGRKKRNNFADLVAIHGGGPVVNHLLAVREHSMFKRQRYKRATNDNQLKLVDMLDQDLFGALPQSYEGELARYKRVKRESV